MAITLRQVAEEAGVSLATVSQILSGRRAEVFPAKTRMRIREIARQMGYRPNLAARSLQQQRSLLIGVLFNASNTTFYSDFLRGVQSVLSATDYSPIVFAHSSYAEQDQCLRRCHDRHVDGLIINATHDGQGGFDMSHFQSVASPDLPVIEVFGRYLPNVPGVNLNYIAGGRAATQHLLDLGHRRIVMLTHERYVLGGRKGSPIHFDAWDRFLGYEAAMRDAGLEPVVITHPISGEIDVAGEFVRGGREVLDRILAHPARPTAVVCYNDLEAYGLFHRARELGFFLPDRLSTVGFGDCDQLEISSLSLTKNTVPAYEVARRAAQALLERINDRPVESVLIESKLVVRDSTREAALTAYSVRGPK